MAWRSSGATNEELVANLAGHGMLPSADTTSTAVDERARAAFLAVDRADYAPRRPYDDAPQGIGYGVTISAPHMHALAVKHLWPYVVPRAGERAPRVLDVGAGSGYLTHVLGEIVGDGGFVLGVEHIPALCRLAETNMRKSAGGRALLDSGRVVLAVGDGRRGAAALAGVEMDLVASDSRFDAIHVGAAATEAHQALIDQLRAPGRLFIPLEDVDSGLQHLWTIDKDVDGTVRRTRLFGVRYVPLTDAPEVL
ncbi:D-aspartate O-methyltransferase [Grosmannia clavigera kw1407]|uniref:protein-L-isoaspartate(D-aspartate) O-methyltransferase n=1 Tax=Grosmannia clavigera (strain kw1407 / UAMH 11150) TaxID=655863 RepID=F0XF37_GROCL|nr:D-aspartate O-methyltransferase [Grosmannia clavigera kw1407]EFX04666.1 D-aspartate O-methyltransferase [Grosmannia clavigera kw1407]